MVLTGLTIAQLLGVLGLFGAATVTLYLLKLRRRQVAVPFIGLWHDVLQQRQSTSLFSRLKRLLSLLIALAVVGALALALADPHLTAASTQARSTVVLVDTGVSMQATDTLPSRLEAARRHARDIVEARDSDDLLLISQMDAVTTPLTPMTRDDRVLSEALLALTPSDLPTNFMAGYRFAMDLLRHRPNPELIVISDGSFERDPELESQLTNEGVALRFISVGKRDANIRLSAFAVRRYPLDKNRSELLVELHNTSDSAKTVELELLGDGRTIDVQSVEVLARSRVRRVYDDISGVDRTLEGRISLGNRAVDDLAVDDRAYAVLPTRRRSRVLCVSQANRYLEAALLLDEYLDVVQISPDAYRSAEGFDVVIFDGYVPDAPVGRPALYLNPGASPGQKLLEVVGTLESPYFDRLRRNDPLLRWTALTDVNVATASKVRLSEGDVAVAAADGGPLIIRGQREGMPFVALSFDIRNSDLPLRIAWPLLLLNSIDSFVEADTSFLSSHDVGQSFRLPAPAGVQQLELTAPDGTHTTLPVSDGHFVFSPGQAGFYTLDAGAETRVLAANLSPASDRSIAPVQQLTVAGSKSLPARRAETRLPSDIWWLLVLAVVAVLSVEWLSFHRRWTV